MCSGVTFCEDEKHSEENYCVCYLHWGFSDANSLLPHYCIGCWRIYVFPVKHSCKGQVGDLRPMLMSMPNFNIHVLCWVFSIFNGIHIS